VLLRLLEDELRGSNSGSWREWKLPGDRPKAHAVYIVGVSDWGANVMCPSIPRRRHSGAILRCFGERAPDPRASRRGLAAGIGPGLARGDQNLVRL